MVAVDEFELDGDDAEVLPAAPRRRWSRPLPWIAASVALVLVGAAAATPFPIIPGRGDGLEFGLLDLDLSTTPTVAWETLGLEYPQIVDAAGDRAVVINADQGVSRTYLGIDLTDGGEVWRHVVAGNACQFEVPLVCVEGGGSLGAQVVVFDTDDGGRTSRPHPGAIAVAAAGDDLVVVEATGGMEEDVVLVEPDGGERWRVAVDAADEIDPMWVPLWVSGRGVTLGFAGVTLDLESGEQTTESYGTWNGFALEQQGDDEIVATGPSGSVTVSATEHLLLYDDDFGGPVRLESADSGVIASLRSDATELWRSNGADCSPIGRLHGVVVMRCYGPQVTGLIGLDEFSGERLWHLPGASWLVAASRDTVVALDEQQDLVLGVDPRTGATPWSVPMSGGSPMGSVAIEGGLLVATQTGLMRLVWE